MTPHPLELEGLHRLHSALSHINRAIVRTRTRAELFSRVCEVLIEHGGFGMAWIGWHEAATHRILPVAQSGDRDGYLQSLRVAADERAEGCGPTGIAFRTNRPSVCNDVFEDPITVPWRPELERRGFGASAAFPIEAGGGVGGTLTVYSDRRGFFQEQECLLLVEAVADISFALGSLEREEERRRAEEIVKRFVAIVESTDDAIVSNTLDGTVTSWNPAAERLFGFRAAEIIGRSVELLIPADRTGEAQAILRRVRRGERIRQLEMVLARKDGSLLPVAVTFSPITETDPATAGATKIVGVSQIVRDMTERRTAEAVLEREQRFASGLIEAMPGIFYLYDEQGHFLRWNSNFERVSGYSADDFKHLHPLDFFTAEERPLLQRRIAEVFEQGTATVEASLLAKDGALTPYFFTGKRIVLDGQPRLLGVGVDIAERKRVEDALRKSEERYRTTLDTMLEACQLVGFDWRYLYLNPAAALQNRRPNAELLGRTMLEVWPGIESTATFPPLRRCMEQRVPVHEEIAFMFPDGTPGVFDVWAQPVPEGIFILSTDITKRKRAEQALRELNESLERKVAERTVDLEAAKIRAEAADRLKSAFLATMSHELRTPLNSILGFTGIVLNGMAGPLLPEQSKQLGMVQGSARHLLDLINDVLDISKIEAGQLEVRSAPFDLRASLDRVAASVRPQLQKKGLGLRVEVPELPEPMESDRRRVEQILLNLVNNAIKFTDHGEVTVTAEVADAVDPSRGGEPRRVVQIRVADTGIGMEQGALSRLFQPFHQIDTGLQRQHEGTGLGLAICRRLSGLLGGTVSAASVFGKGSVFTVVLPLHWEKPR